jgi:drug/metabolite transporter (DMT)-like permease
VGQNLTNASDAALLANLAPTLVPFIAFIALKDSIGNVQKTATALGLVGLVLIAAPKLSLGSGTVIGDLLLFGTSACYAVFIVLSKRYEAISSASAFAIMVSIGVFLAPVATLLGGLDHTNLNFGLIGWFSVLYLGVPGSVIAVALYLKGLGSITASQSGTLLLVQLLTGLFLAILILNEFPTSFEIADAIAVSVAVALSTFGIRG